MTLGAEGALVVSEGGAEAVQAYEARVVDSTGAGDCVAGVLAAGLAMGAPREGLTPVVSVAMTAAAGMVGVWGATDGLPSPADARAQLTVALAK